MARSLTASVLVASTLLGVGVTALAHCQAYDRAEYDALTRARPDAGVGDADVADASPDADADACAPAPANNPCSFLPPLTMAQVVDGKDDEFCGVGARVFAAASGVAVTVDGSTTTSAPSAVAASATVRAAWSAAGVHVFVHVDKAPVISTPSTGQLYANDAVELFFAGTSNLTGAYGGASSGDRGAVHIIVAPPDPAGGGAPGRGALFQLAGNEVADLLPSQYATRLVDGGFDVEVGLDWGTLGLASPPAAGAVVAFDLGLDLRLPADGGSFRFQSFLGILQSAVANATGCTDYIAPFCDDRLWCTPTLQ